MTKRLVTLKEAAEVMGVSYRHVQRLVEEANTIKQSRWRYGREIVNLSPATAVRRTLRINLSAVFAVDAPAL
jgi:excisionase family DNA binding protein|tara:strand:+ start:371 stop:586 length:216 start_codon:yes stop_codon:yes gene_type:complete